MKKHTGFLLVIALFISVNNINAQCDLSVFTYLGHNRISWETSGYYEIINLDAETLTDRTLYPRTGASSGEEDNSNYGSMTVKSPVASGEIITPLYDYKDGNNVESGKTYSIKYWNCVFAPEHYGSAYTKDMNGTFPSGNGGDCTKNDNSVLTQEIFSKKGFIELSRQGSTEAEGSKHGGVQLDGLRRIDKIQWSFSSTSWKRGVMCEVKWGKDGEWQIQRSVPTGVGGGNLGYAIFSEQGYQFEELFNLGDNEESEDELSIRFRVWDGDETTWKDAYETGERPAEFFYKAVDPYDEISTQVVRIHQIKVYSGLQGSQFAEYLTNGLDDIDVDEFTMIQSGDAIHLSVECDVEVYTVEGTLLKREFGNEINISGLGLSKGIYLIKATAANGMVKTKKIIL